MVSPKKPVIPKPLNCCFLSSLVLSIVSSLIKFLKKIKHRHAPKGNLVIGWNRTAHQENGNKTKNYVEYVKHSKDTPFTEKDKKARGNILIGTWCGDHLERSLKRNLIVLFKTLSETLHKELRFNSLPDLQVIVV